MQNLYKGQLFGQNNIVMRFNPFIMETKKGLLEFYEELTNVPDQTIQDILSLSTGGDSPINNINNH